MPVDERALWGDQLSVLDGDVTGWDGRPLHMRTVIARAWGWPKRAAVLVQEHYRSVQARTGNRARVHLQDPARTAQQVELLAAVPDLQRTLLAGLAGRTTREAPHAHLPLNQVVLSFDRPVTDDGLVSSIMDAVSQRLGATMEELRATDDSGEPTVSFIHRRGTRVEVFVRSSSFEV